MILFPWLELFIEAVDSILFCTLSLLPTSFKNYKRSIIPEEIQMSAYIFEIIIVFDNKCLLSLTLLGCPTNGTLFPFPVTFSLIFKNIFNQELDLRLDLAFN